jgi:hypothetical protein
MEEEYSVIEQKNREFREAKTEIVGYYAGVEILLSDKC